MSKAQHLKTMIKNFEQAVARASNELSSGFDHRELIKAEADRDRQRKDLFDYIDRNVK